MVCFISWARISGGLTCFVERRRSLLRVQSLRDTADEDPRQGKAADWQGEDRNRDKLCRPTQPPRGPLKVTMKVAGKIAAEGTVPVSTPICFTANECLDIGIALGSPVSLDYYDKAPFKFNGTIEQVHVRYAAAK